MKSILDTEFWQHFNLVKNIVDNTYLYRIVIIENIFHNLSATDSTSLIKLDE